MSTDRDLVEMRCPSCGAKVEDSADLLEKRSRCPKCERTVRFKRILQAPSEAEPGAPDQQPWRVPATNESASKMGKMGLRPADLRTATVRITEVRDRPAADKRHTAGLAIGALVLAVLGAAICPIPPLAFLGMPLVLIGLALGLIALGLALTAGGKRVALPVAGAGVSVAALIIVLLFAASPGEGPGDARVRRRTGWRPGRGSGSARADANEPASEEPVEPLPRPTVELGPLQICVEGCRIGHVELESFGDVSLSEDKVLAVTVVIENPSETTEVKYGSWDGRKFAFGRFYATLKDNRGRDYKRVDFEDLKTIRGAVTLTKKAAPGRPIRDVLAFEAPTDEIAYLVLELPARNVHAKAPESRVFRPIDEDALLRLRIPGEMITVED